MRRFDADVIASIKSPRCFRDCDASEKGSVMLPKRFHDDNEPIVALKRFRIYKNGENIGKHLKTSEHGLGMDWTGGFWKRRSRESIGVWKDVGRLWETSEMSECGIGQHQKCWSME